MGVLTTRYSSEELEIMPIDCGTIYRMNVFTRRINKVNSRDLLNYIINKSRVSQLVDVGSSFYYINAFWV